MFIITLRKVYSLLLFSLLNLSLSNLSSRFILLPLSIISLVGLVFILLFFRMANISIRSLLFLFISLFFAANIVPVCSYPTNLPNTTQVISKRTPNPKIPTTEEAAKHLKPLGSGKQVFYRMECHEAASHLAREIGGGLLANADNGDHWASFDGGPFKERNLRMIDDEPTWTNRELDAAMQSVSNAYAMNAEGDAIVVLPYYMPNSPDWWDGEFEVLKKNPKVDKVLAYDMKNVKGVPQGSPRELWPKAQPKTEHAG